MKITLVGKNLRVTEGLRAHATKKAHSIARLLNARATLRLVSSVQKGMQLAEATLQLDGFTFRAHARSNDLYGSIDAVIEKLERQVRRLKDRWHSHGKHTTAARAQPLTSAALQELRESFRGEVEHLPGYSRKPMALEEACLQLELSDLDFLPFVNSSSAEVNILVRLDQDRYGLIAPEPA